MGLPGEARRAPRVEVPAGAPRVEPADASGWMRTKRRYTLRPLRPVAGAINPGLRTDAQRARDQRQPRPPDWTDDEGPASTPSLRPALPAESYLESAAAAFPRGRPWGERIIPRVGPGQQGPCPQVSMAGNTGKARQRNHYHRPETRVVSLARVNARIVQSSS